jgi:2-polyprenyl-3-methyl-5-hydroxy-6-metoxy-1,4-benzoquinol methylase
MKKINLKKFTNVEKDLCPSCNFDQTKYLGMRGGKYQREGLGIESRIVQCLNCSLIYPNPFPIPESLESIYGDPDEYFSGKEEWYERSKNYEKLVEKFIRIINKDKIELLDIGAGRGEFNKAALSFPQVTCTGLEVSEGSILFAKEHGIEIHNKLLIELINEGRTFDGICLNAVIEHVHEPSKFISEVSMLLKQGGVIYIDCPNEPNLLTMTGNFFNMILGKKDIYNLQPTWEPYHVFGFNPKALRILLEKNDIEINEVLIHGAPGIPFAGGFKDRIKVLLAILIQRIANIISLGTNMYVWGRKL